MANLIVDIGNTAVKASWCDVLTLGKTFRYQGEKVLDFISEITGKEKPSVMVVSSVYDIYPKAEKLLSSMCEKLVILDGRHIEVMEKHGFPSHLSYDRVASLIAARYLFKDKPLTVFDFGTTLSVDYLGEDGGYEGGNVALGCRTRFKALNRYSKSLPLMNMPSDSDVIGSDLTTSIESGVISGIVFEIEGYIMQKQGNIIVFTGGDANYFAKRMKNSIFVICNLVLIGLALIADEYVKKIS